uniref:LRR-RLK n=1 Tax=Rhizophora mucronata TaxID=61149 RepID=A0A2P2LBZ3_RHIMU
MSLSQEVPSFPFL